MPYFIGGFIFALVVIHALDEEKKDKADRGGR